LRCASGGQLHRRAGSSDLVLSVCVGWVYFEATLRTGALSGVWRGGLAGGPAGA